MPCNLNPYSKMCALLVAGAASLAVAQPAHAREETCLGQS